MQLKNVKPLIWAAAVLLLVFLYRETSMNFTFLGCLALVLMGTILIFSFNGIKPARDGDIPPLRNATMGLNSAILITVFSMFTLYTLKNYFYADKSVYTNNEYHALRIDGVRIPKEKVSGFLLAKNDNSAFFDNKLFSGSIAIKSVDTSIGVTLNLKGFSHPVYRYTSSKDSGRVDYGKNVKLISFTNMDTLQFVSKKGECVEFWVEEHNAGKGLLKNGRDTAAYNFRNLATRELQKSNVSKALVRGYSLNGLAGGITNSNIDFNGISVVRYEARHHAKIHEIVSNIPTQYLLDVNGMALDSSASGGNEVETVIIGDKRYNLGDLGNLDHSLTIPFGETYYIGYGDTQTPLFYFEKDKDGLVIKFKMPYRRQLYGEKGKDENCLYVTGSLVRDTETETAKGIGINLPDNVALFNIFSHSNNKHQFEPFRLAYVSGSATELLSVLHEEQERVYKIEGNESESIEGIKAKSGAEWLFKIENLRESTPFTAERMLWVVFFVCIASIITSVIHMFKYGSDSFIMRYTFSYVEFALHIVLIFSIAFRCFLLWRTSVFLPLENITLHEWYTIFRNEGSLYVLLASLAGFYFVLAAMKLIVLNCRLPEKRRKGKIFGRYDLYDFIDECFLVRCSKKWALLVPVILYVAGLAFKSQPRVALVIIVIAYFVMEMLIYARSRFNSYNLDNEMGDVDGRIELISEFFKSLGNMAMAVISIFLIRDTGFLIMFATFCLFAVGFKLHDLFFKLSGRGGSNWKYALCVLVYIAFVFLMLICYKGMVLWAVNSPVFILLFALVAVAAFYGVLRFAGLDLGCVKKENKSIAIAAGTCAAVLAGAIVMTVCMNFSDDGNTVKDHLPMHTKQRIRVLEDSVHEILANVEKDEDEIRLLQASHNHWILAEYHRRSGNVSLFGERGAGYFKIHPQSKLGAMWNAQVTDIVLIRYVITEHSKILAVIFLMLLAGMLFYGMRMTAYYRFTKNILVQVPLLLFVQGMLIWMANTQRFIFFGQDFPLLSLTSKTMLIYVFALLLIWCAAAVIESVMYRKLDGSYFNSFENHYKLQSYVVLGVVALMLFVTFVAGQSAFRLKDGDRQGSYTVAIKERTDSFIKGLDSLFAEYQDTHELDLRRDMHQQISLFNENYKEKIDTLFEGNHFMCRIWDNFVNEDSRCNSYSNIIHVRNRNISSEDDMRLEILLKSDFYDMLLPDHSENEWKGNIVEYSHTGTSDVDTVITGTGYKFYQIPQSWLREGRSPFFIKSTEGVDLKVFSIEKNRYVDVQQGGMGCAVALESSDVVYVAGEKEDKLPIGNHNYWARNILVNGKHRFIYPQGEQMFWIRDFARVAKDVKEKQMEQGASAGVYTGDIALTLNRKLTGDIYDIYKKKMGGKVGFYPRSVIVADGNGHIRAMVDYKKGYILNPNNDERISEITEDLYMNYDNKRYQTESYWFENRNLAHMWAGPGSSQKPLVWNALASEVKFDWSKLQLVKVHVGKLLDGVDNNKYLNLYNGERMAEFKYQRPDELRGEDNVDMVNYLAHSSNYYNALLVYLGLHNKDHYANREFLSLAENANKDTEKAFRKSKDPVYMGAEEYRENYPFFRIGGNDGFLQLNHKISREDYDRSVLYHHFTSVHGMKDALTNNRYRGNLYNMVFSDTSIYAGYTIPAVSSLNLSVLSDDKKQPVVNSGMVNIAIGGATYWTVTPIHMAQMYGKVVSMNDNYKLSFDPSHNPDYTKWQGGNDQYGRHRHKMFEGMNKFFTQKHKSGTMATGVGLVKDLNKPVGQKIVNGKIYYFYGKTGTTGFGKSKKGKKVDLNNDSKRDEFRRLAIVISDTNLHSGEVDMSKVKFYVLYFTHEFFFKGDGFSEIASSVIDEVVNSEVFNNYMNSTKK